MLNLNKNGLEWAETALHNPGEPIASFPGDDTVPLSYAEAMIDDPKELGLPLVTIRGVVKVAQNFGVEIDPPTFEQIKRMAFAPEAADVWLDQPGLTPEERARRHEIGTVAVRAAFGPDVGDRALSNSHQALIDQNPRLYSAMRYWGNSARTMPEWYRQHALQHALGCLELSLAKSRAASFGEYAPLTYHEAEQYGFLWATTAWSGQGERPLDDGKFEDFRCWMGTFVGSISVLGAAFDLRKDYRNGLIAFKPAPVRQGLALIAQSFEHAEGIPSSIARWKYEKYRSKFLHLFRGSAA